MFQLPMRVAPERLIFLALAVLHRAAWDTEDLPKKPDIAVRVALAVLFAFSRSGDRAPDDRFCHCLSDPYLKEYSDTSRGVRRKQESFGAITQIARDVGVPEHGPYQEKLSELVIGRAKHPWRPGTAFEHEA